MVHTLATHFIVATIKLEEKILGTPKQETNLAKKITKKRTVIQKAKQTKKHITQKILLLAYNRKYKIVSSL